MTESEISATSQKGTKPHPNQTQKDNRHERRRDKWLFPKITSALKAFIYVGARAGVSVTEESVPRSLRVSSLSGSGFKATCNPAEMHGFECGVI